MDNQTITITFGDQAENHRGMQVIGTAAEKGFTLGELLHAQNYFNSLGCHCELIHLNQFLPVGTTCQENAYILVAKSGVNGILKEHNFNAVDLFNEQVALDFDKKAFMYGRVVNKHARWNLCYADFEQEPNYEEGRGRIVNFNTIPITNIIRHSLKNLIPSAENLQGESNYYYDITKCGIGMHNDCERLKVVGIRLGATMPLCYNWFLENQPIGTKCTLNLNGGDIYIMSEKATGNDGKRRKIPTLRHAAGCDKYTNI
jgi:hypothetical protein